MKNITLSIPDHIYQQARIAAAERNMSLSALVREYLGSLQRASLSHEEQVAVLFEALDKGRNQTPIGALNRDDLYDRNSLH